MVAEAWRHGFKTLKARIHEGNVRSARLLDRLGFVETAPAEPEEVRPRVFVSCRRFSLARPGPLSSSHRP